MSNTVQPRIRPELVAAKLAAIRNHECPKVQKEIEERPRLVEAMWFLQFMSFQPGGLSKFASDFLDSFPERVGTPSICKARKTKPTRELKLDIRDEIGLASDPSWRWEIEDRRMRADEYERDYLEHFDLGKEVKTCREEAKRRLPALLSDLCTDKSMTFKSASIAFFQGLAEALLEMLDRHAEAKRESLVMTEVAKIIFRDLDFAIAERALVRIEGNTRFGKTETITTWCEMRPGRARYVRVPCSNSMADLFKHVGEALGIDCAYGSNISRLKDRIEYVLQHSELFLVLDEAHFLIPQNYSRTTPPHRLNWVRTEIVDRDLPLAMAATPQTFDRSMGRFVKTTGYIADQFFGRESLRTALPSSITEADMLAVARHHFPGMDEDALIVIANRARLSRNFLQAVEWIARRIRFLAGGKRVTVAILDKAISEVLPGSIEQEVERKPASANTGLKAAKRAVKPESQDPEFETFGNRSLRGTGPEVMVPAAAA